MQCRPLGQILGTLQCAANQGDIDTDENEMLKTA